MYSTKNIKSILEEKNEELRGSDSFLCKDLLTLANKLNGSRNIMFHNHLDQYVVLKNTEFPRVFTGYENKVAKYSKSNNKADRTFKVIDKIEKNELNYVLLVQYDDGEYDAILRTEAQHLTESYCYKYKNDFIDSLKPDDVVEKGKTIFNSTSFDNQGNYGFGVNAKTVYMICNETTEDAIVASDEFAKKMSHYSLTPVEVSINTNDILINLYGDVDEYKAFPNIGEETQGKVLVARRRLSYENVLYDLKNDNLRKINYFTDKVFYESGTVVDIDIFCNKKEEELNDVFYSQFKDYITEQNEYYMKLKEKLDIILEDKENPHTDMISYLYKKAKSYLLVDDEDTVNKWDNDGVFDNITIVFYILREKPLKIGSKLTGRYGRMLPPYTVMYIEKPL